MDPGTPEGGITPDPDAFLAYLRAGDAAEARRRERWNRQLLVDSSSVGGALAAAVDNPVTLFLVTGRRLAGTLGAAGEHVARLEAHAVTMWVSTAAVVAVECTHELPAAGPLPGGPTMAEVLADLVDGPTVTLGLAGGTELRGRIVGAGEDAVVLAGRSAGRSYASVDAVAWVSAPA